MAHMSIPNGSDPYVTKDPIQGRLDAIQHRAVSATRDEWAEAVRAVLDVHEPVKALDFGQRASGRLTHVCAGCGSDDGNWNYWPCPTVRAITTSLGVRA